MPGNTHAPALRGAAAKTTNGASGRSEQHGKHSNTRNIIVQYQPITHSSIVVLHLEDNGDGGMGVKVGLHRGLAAASH